MAKIISEPVTSVTLELTVEEAVYLHACLMKCTPVPNGKFHSGHDDPIFEALDTFLHGHGIVSNPQSARTI